MMVFLTISNRSLKILQNLSEGHMNVAEHFPKNYEDYQRLSRNTQYYVENLKTSKQVVCMRRKILFTIFKYLFSLIKFLKYANFDQI